MDMFPCLMNNLKFHQGLEDDCGGLRSFRSKHKMYRYLSLTIVVNREKCQLSFLLSHSRAGWYSYLNKRRVPVARMVSVKWSKYLGILSPKLILAIPLIDANFTIVDTNHELFVVNYSFNWW